MIPSGGVTRELIRVDSDQEDHDRRRARTTASSRVKREHGSVPVAQPDIPVINIVTGEEEDQQIVATPEMLNPRNIGAGDYKFQKVFSEGNYIASGVLVMPKGSHKPNKNSAQSTMIFVVLSGKVEVQVNRTTFVVAKEATFMVPRGNQYRISNPFTTEARLYFCHGKEVVAEADTDT
ncbi:Mif2/CENP-C like-domain-containing protein [Fimicolochytrium jonesii]|uniref:Mif2/CENP-C like-domain-containing protein n=1 Tax=Fimicolochytrium jonesii TaxID=1396493 RepID=UPI0022FE34AD|nr:Mif2/CENP-C like-domain-containing protein [Fimicolochytrium jonesii]KAI8820168.1 Mif2/CENP-C like-domain-containing protein [Fimicolochytrium jonesii]